MQKALKALTHTARMLMALERKPEADVNGEYRRQIDLYKYDWARLDAKDREVVLSVAGENIHDMTPDVLQAAVAALES